MGPRTILVYLSDEIFASRLVDYWSKKAPQFRFGECSDEFAAATGLQGGPVYLYISDKEGYAKVDWEQIDVREIGRLVMLREDEGDAIPLVKGRLVNSVDRYQPADELLAEALGMRELVNASFIGEKVAFGSSAMMLNLPDRPFSELGMEIRETDEFYFDAFEEPAAVKKLRVIGVYSPVGRCGKTRMSIQIAKECSKDGKAVLVCLERYSDLYEWSVKQKQPSVSDLVYMLRTGQKEKAAKALGKEPAGPGDILYFSAAANPEDIGDIKIEELEELLDLASGEGVTSLVIDVGSTYWDPCGVMTICDEVYSPVTDSETSRKKWAHFNSFIKKKDRKKILQKVETVQLPDMGDSFDQNGFPVITEEGRSFVEKLVSREEKYGAAE